MKNKQNIYSLILGLVCLVAGTLLLVLCVPNQIPVFVDFSEKVTATSSKWLMLLLCVSPLVLAIIQIFTCKKVSTFLFRYAITILTYENMLAFIYLCTEQDLSTGTYFGIPLSLMIFLPLSASIMIAGIKLKTRPYKSKLGIRMKYCLETEFIWKQTHYIARDIFFFAGFALSVTSIVFAFFRVTWIEIPIFIIVMVICLLKIRWYAKSMYDKYKDMELKKNSLNKN